MVVIENEMRGIGKLLTHLCLNFHLLAQECFHVRKEEGGE